MSYVFKVQVKKLDESAPYLWPYITDFHPVGPGGYTLLSQDGGVPTETYTFKVHNAPTDMWFLTGYNVQVIPEGSSWYWNFLVNIGYSKITVLSWFTFEGYPLITWEFSFLLNQMAFTLARSSDAQLLGTQWDVISYPNAPPFLDSFAQNGDARVYWYLHFTGNMGFARIFPVDFLNVSPYSSLVFPLVK